MDGLFERIRDAYGRSVEEFIASEMEGGHYSVVKEKLTKVGFTEEEIDSLVERIAEGKSLYPYTWVEEIVKRNEKGN